MLLAAVVTAYLPSAASGQEADRFRSNPDSVRDTRLLRRWVGAQMNGLPLWLDFYGDSMLVISDRFTDYPVDYAVTPFTLIVYGDSMLIRTLAIAFNRRREGEDFGFQDRFEMGWRFSLEKLILQADGNTITMSPQNVLARRFEARWIADLADGTQMELFLDRQGTAVHRVVPGGSRVVGEWDRAFRDITFDWTPDSLETPDSTRIWQGSYDADGQQIILESVGEGTSVTIFRRIIR